MIKGGFWFRIKFALRQRNLIAVLAFQPSMILTALGDDIPEKFGCPT